ncbi:MAG: uridine kinase [Propionibacteriaceae bacterium]|nr:uridine kinase [Propionibacteriaceae bacterium]
MTSRTLLLVAGPSGCGKSRLSRAATDAGGVATLPLDEFYRDLDHPGLPRTLGIVDWDDVASWDCGLAIDTISRLLECGSTEVPLYDISQSLRVGSRTLDMGDARVLLAEGIFAPPLLAAARAAGLPVEALWLARHRSTNFSRRLIRDLREKRKSPTVLLRRGVAIYRSEPQLTRDAMAAGFRPVGMREATRLVAALAGVKDGQRPSRTTSVSE